MAYFQLSEPRVSEQCPRTFLRARNFSALIAVVREAERRLTGCGFASPESRIHVLRGIYYGTPWSADYLVERSDMRNVGFQTYTASSMPADPRPCLACGLFEALRQSQDISDGSRRVDFGHLMIGLDARRSVIARSAPIPTQGGTGLELATWLGDLGGGAAMLALRRAGAPTASALTVFSGTDFGGSINLEGDVAGYLVARDRSVTDRPSAPQFPPGGTIADALEAYLGSSGPTTDWNNRAGTFLSILGAVFDAAGNLANRAALIQKLADQIEAFACWYLINRLRQTGRLTLTTLTAASNHLSGAAREVAQVIVDALEFARTHPGSAIAARPPGPPPSPPRSPSGLCRAAIATVTAGQQVIEGAERRYRQGREILRQYSPF